MRRIDRAVIPSGLIARARTYTLVRDAHGYYVLHTGPATNVVRMPAGPTGALAGALANRLTSPFEATIARAEARVDTASLDELAREKHCHFIPCDQVRSVTVKEGWGPTGRPVTVATLRGPKKLRFHFRETPADRVRSFFADDPTSPR